MKLVLPLVIGLVFARYCVRGTGLREAIDSLNWFAVDESYRVPARLEAYPEPKELLIPNVLGGHFKMKSPGVLRFALGGQEYSLHPVLNDDGSLFLIFRDAF